MSTETTEIPAPPQLHESATSKCSLKTSQKRSLNINILNHSRMKKCDMCDYQCTQIDQLTQHMQTHSEGITYKCDYCKFRTSQQEYLKKHELSHIKSTGSKEKPYGCGMCNFQSSKMHNMKKHLVNHSEVKPFKCHLCSNCFPRLNTLKMHIYNSHTRARLYKCDMCVYETTNVRELRLHNLTHFEQKLYECDICKYKTPLKHTLRKHMETHSERRFKCDKCLYKTSRMDLLKRHKLTHGDGTSSHKNYKCDLCQYSSNNIAYVNRHKEIHGKQQFECSYCSYRTSYKSALYLHIKNHGLKKLYECGECNYKSVHPSSVRLHRKQHHTNIESLKDNNITYRKKDTNKETYTFKPYECGICKFRTANEDNLLRHRVIHYNYYRCNLCDYKTRVRNELRYHLVVHSLKADEETDRGTNSKIEIQQDNKENPSSSSSDLGEKKLHKCDLCDFQSPFAIVVKQHKVTHLKKVYKCNLCDFKSSDVAVVKEHKLTHAEMEELKCDMCDFKTPHKDILKAHNITHNIKSQFDDVESSNDIDIEEHDLILPKQELLECDMCNFKSTSADDMQEHNLTHDNKNENYYDVKCDMKSSNDVDIEDNKLTLPKQELLECDYNL